MQSEHLVRLSKPVQQLVLEVEEGSGVEINVILDPKQNEGGTGQGILAVVIKAQSIQLFAPTNGYFPDGAVLHEVLHVRRFHVDGVPKLALADSEEWDKGFSDALGDLDNAIEHVVIVPEELQFHPDRRKHWETGMQDVCLALPDVPDGERRLAVCLHWTFLRHVLPDSPAVEIARSFAKILEEPCGFGIHKQLDWYLPEANSIDRLRQEMLPEAMTHDNKPSREWVPR